MTQPIPAAPPSTTPRVDHNAEWDAPDDDVRRRHPSEVRDRGVLDSFGRAVSAPLQPQPEPPTTAPEDKQ